MSSSYQPNNEARFKNYYEVLRVRPNDSPELIRAAYIAQIKQWHPDRFQNADPQTRIDAVERSKVINEAKRILLDPASKSAYDAEFEARFPRRWEKLTSKSRPKSRQLTVEELLRSGVPINPLSQAERSDPTSFVWLNFSARVNPRTKRVVFNLAHFLERNPECEVRLQYDRDQEWTPYSRLKIHTYQYQKELGLAKMQARYVDPKGKVYYSKVVPKTIILGKYTEAMGERNRILKEERKRKMRVAFKLILVILTGVLLLKLSSTLGYL